VLAAERRAAESGRAARTAAAEERRRQRTRLESWLADLRREHDAAAERLAAIDREAGEDGARLAGECIYGHAALHSCID